MKKMFEKSCILAILIMCVACSTSRIATQTDFRTHIDTFYCHSVDTFIQTEYIHKNDSVVVRDSVVVFVDSAGKELRRSEWHWNLLKIMNDASMNTVSIQRDSLAKMVSDNIQTTSTTVIKNEIGWFDRLKAGLFWYLIVVILALLLYIKVKE